MKAYTVDLKEEYPVQGGKLECLLMDMPFDCQMEWKRPAMIVVPGGGYAMVSKREGAPIAAAYFARGFQTFILTYLCVGDDVRYPEQLCELAAAVDYVKKNADALHVNKDEIFLVGFSAGGHLVGNLAVDYQSVPQKMGVDVDCKPTAVGLSYPVISHEYGHVGSHNNLFNGYTDEAKAELYKATNLDKKVTNKTVPAFIWATATDEIVPVKNSLAFASACAEQGVPFELHIYPQGNHGLATGDFEITPNSKHDGRIARWLDDSNVFFRQYVKEDY